MVSREHVPLLVHDPELAAGVPEHDLERARRAVVLPLVFTPVGPFELANLVDVPTLGFILLDGMVRTTVTLGGQSTVQLAGPGDILHSPSGSPTLLPARIAFDAAEASRLAILDHRFISAGRRWPGLLVALNERLRDQQHRLAVHAAIGKLRHVNDRVLAALWQVGEQWGRVTAIGIEIPLALTHETIGKLAGASRPTVTTALAELDREGAISRRADGRFVLEPESWSRLTPPGSASIGLRRRTREGSASRPSGSTRSPAYDAE